VGKGGVLYRRRHRRDGLPAENNETFYNFVASCGAVGNRGIVVDDIVRKYQRR
jgi:hypothetical protein